MYYHLTDHQFSTVALIDSSATFLERVTYDAYGMARYHWAADVTGDGAVGTADRNAASAALNKSIGDPDYNVDADVTRKGTVTSTDGQWFNSANFKAALPKGDLSAYGNVIGFCGYVFNPEVPTTGGGGTMRQRPADLDDDSMRRLFIVEFDTADAARVLWHRPDLKDVSAMAFSSDGSRLALVSSRSSTISMIDTINGHDVGDAVPVGVGTGHAAIIDLALGPNDTRLATISSDGTVRLWSALGRGNGSGTTKEPIFELLSTMHGQQGQFTGLAFSPDNSHVVTSASGGTIRWWDATLTSDPWVLPTPATPYQLAFSPDGERLAAACPGGERPLRIWQVKTGRSVLEELDLHTSAAAFSTDGRILAVGRSLRGVTTVVDSHDGTTLAEFPGHQWRTDWVALSDQDTLLSLGNNGMLTEHDLKDGGVLRRLKFASNAENHGCRAALSPDRSLLVVASSRDVHFLDGSTWETLDVVRTHAGLIYALTFSADGKLLVTVASDGILHAWDVAKRATKATMAGHTGEIFAAALSPDGSRIVSGGRDGVVRVWDTQRFEEITQLRGHSSLIYSLAFSPDGRTLASGGGDAKVNLWDRHLDQEGRADRERLILTDEAAATDSR